MATEFIIKKGRSTSLFDEDGNCKIPQGKLIENGWYLTTDTAEVYVALRSTPGDFSSDLVLRKLNECDVDTDFADLESFDKRLTALEQEDRLHTYGYREGFPKVGEEGHMYVAVDEQKTYVYFDDNYLVVGEVNDEPAPAPDIIFGGSAEE